MRRVPHMDFPRSSTSWYPTTNHTKFAITCSFHSTVWHMLVEYEIYGTANISMYSLLQKVVQFCMCNIEKFLFFVSPSTWNSNSQQFRSHIYHICLFSAPWDFTEYWRMVWITVVFVPQYISKRQKTGFQWGRLSLGSIAAWKNQDCGYIRI